MFEGRLMRRLLGSGIAVFGLLTMIGAAGCVESGAMSIGTAVFRMMVGCLIVTIGAVMFGGLE